MVDESCNVAADMGVPAPRAVHPEDPDAPLGEVTLLAFFACLVVANQLAGVVDDAGVLRNRLGRKYPVTVDVRAPADDLRKLFLSSHLLLRYTAGVSRTAAGSV